MTTSPAENGAFGVNVTVWSAFESVKVPLAVPLPRPKTRMLEELTVGRFTARSKVMLIGVPAGAIVFGGGESAVTVSS